MPRRYLSEQRPNAHHAPDRDHDGESLAEWIKRNNRPRKGGMTFQQWLARPKTPATAGNKKNADRVSGRRSPHPEEGH